MDRARVNGLILMVFLLLMIIAQTSGEQEPYKMEVNWGTDHYFAVKNVSSIVFEFDHMGIFLETDATGLVITGSGKVYILIHNNDYSGFINITVYRDKDNNGAVAVHTVTDDDEETLVTNTHDLADLVIIVHNHFVQIGYRMYHHHVNLSDCSMKIEFEGEGTGYLEVIFNSKKGIEPGVIEIPINASPPDPLKAITDFFGLLGIIWIGFVTFFNLIIAVFNIVWQLILFVFNYINMGLNIFVNYILPHLTLFMGIYFFGTLAVAVGSLPRKGLEAFIDWGKLWYSHIMALVNFIKMLAEWAYKLINIIIKLIDTITPFT